MANKKKAEPIEPIEAEVIEEEAAEEVKEEVTEASEPTHDDFVTRKLKAINAMQKPAKAQRLANRVLRKARNK